MVAVHAVLARGALRGRGRGAGICAGLGSADPLRKETLFERLDTCIQKSKLSSFVFVLEVTVRVHTVWDRP